MDFTPVELDEIPVGTRGRRGGNTETEELVNAFISSGAKAAKVDLDGKKAGSVRTTIGKFCSDKELGVSVKLRGAADETGSVYIVLDPSAVKHYQGLKVKLAAAKAAEAAKAAAKEADSDSDATDEPAEADVETDGDWAIDPEDTEAELA
jgi:hypothetical protein